jgi:uncharacterized protein YciI
LGHGPAWDDTSGIREKDGWDNHAEFMTSLVADRLIVVGGPVGRGDFTAHLVEAADEQEIRNRLAEDPWAIDAHLTVESVEPWSLWLDGRHTRSSTNDDAGGARNRLFVIKRGSSGLTRRFVFA